MTDLTQFNPNAVGNPDNNIFGLPFTEEDARVILLPVPWEVTVSYGSGTSRAADHILKSSFQVDLFDPETKDGWKAGFFMKQPDRKILLKSDYLRKEAELYIDYISKGNDVKDNKFMSKSLREINEGSKMLNTWVFDETKALLDKDKLVGVIGGDHSVPFGFYQALAEKHGEFGILQIDAHADLRAGYEDFVYSHASIMYNALNEIPQLQRIVQVGVRDFGEDEFEFINSNDRIVTYFDKDIKERQFEGQTWKQIVDEIVDQLPQKVHISLDVDGLDPKLCPNTGTPVAGGFEVEQVYYLFKKVIESGRKLIGFDLDEVSVGAGGIDTNVGARILYLLCNLLVKSNS